MNIEVEFSRTENTSKKNFDSNRRYSHQKSISSCQTQFYLENWSVKLSISFNLTTRCSRNPILKWKSPATLGKIWSRALKSGIPLQLYTEIESNMRECRHSVSHTDTMGVYARHFMIATASIEIDRIAFRFCFVNKFHFILHTPYIIGIHGFLVLVHFHHCLRHCFLFSSKYSICIRQMGVTFYINTNQQCTTLYASCYTMHEANVDGIRMTPHTVNDGKAVEDSIPPFTCFSTQPNVKWNGIVVHQYSNRFLLNDEWCLQLSGAAVRQPMLRNTHYNFKIFFVVYFTWTLFAFSWFFGHIDAARQWRERIRCMCSI